MARIKYYRIPKRLPDADDVEGLGDYWLKYYIMQEGKGRWISGWKRRKSYLKKIHLVPVFDTQRYF